MRGKATPAGARLVPIRFLGTFVAALLLSYPISAVRAEDAAAPFVVVLRAGGDVGALTTQLRARDGIEERAVFTSALQGFAADLTVAQRARLARDPQVAFIEPDRSIELAGTAVPAGIDRVEADLAPAAGIDGRGGSVDADVALIDTGIQRTHSELNVVGGHDCVPGGSDSWTDGHGHGTFVAGIVGARDDGDSVVGMAPGARLWSVRAFDSAGHSKLSWIICAIDWVTSHRDGSRPRIEVANMSLRDPGRDDGACGSRAGDAEHAAICRSVAAGTTYVVAAGNDSTPASRWIPAAYNEVITVSALADFDGIGGGFASPTCSAFGSRLLDDRLAAFSNYGADIDLIAPGACIRSTALGGGTTVSSGTSYASPMVAGAAALYLSDHPGASPANVRAVLRAGGSQDWIVGSDPDTAHEPLLNAHAIGGSPDGSRPTVSPPRGRIVAGGVVTAGGSVPVRFTWTGSDAGTGIAHYDLWRSTDAAGYGRIPLPSARVTTFLAWLLPGHSYRHRTDAWDHGGNTSPMMVGTLDRLAQYQSRHASVRYTGSWKTATTPGSLGSGSTYSTDSGARATLSFTGRQVAWVGARGTAGGRARVELDGQSLGTIDLRRSGAQPRRILIARAAASGAHTLRITVLGGRVDVDAFLVVR